MPAFYRSTLAEFVAASDRDVVAQLSLAYALEGFSRQQTEQTLAWARDLGLLRSCCAAVVGAHPVASAWSVLLEFTIPRKLKRIDVVLLAGESVVLLELKTCAPTNEDALQVEEYALLLHYFHEPSRSLKIHPLLVSSQAGFYKPNRQIELSLTETAAYWIAPVERVGWEELAGHLGALMVAGEGAPDAGRWESGEYRPVPTIIDAAVALRSGLSIREIAHSRAARHDVDDLTRFVEARVLEAQRGGLFTICFVTGVPGSGKTLVGLNLAFGSRAEEPIHFMSGNGPLVMVLQAVLARHRRAEGVRALDAKMHAKTLIENVHVFAKTYTEDALGRAPSNHVVIFDEAQRAWNREQNLAKFKRPYSEPEMLLKIMERHPDWAVVVALVGGGQEINNGEAGLEEWGRSLASAAKRWTIYASPEALEGGASVAGGRLTTDPVVHLDVDREDQLHLRVPVRNLQVDSYALWVNSVLDGRAVEARTLETHLYFPVLLTRHLATARRALRTNTLGSSRCGLVGSSQAARLRAEGLEPDSSFHAEYPWEHWYLAPDSDVRSSFQCEVFATEFEIQGLELDWVGVCWGGDFIWDPDANEWRIRSFRAVNSRWSEVKSVERRKYRRNAYRVLLTRARQGVVIYVPEGAAGDPTRAPEEFEATADFLLRCGAKLLA